MQYSRILTFVKDVNLINDITRHYHLPKPKELFTFYIREKTFNRSVWFPSENNILYPQEVELIQIKGGYFGKYKGGPTLKNYLNILDEYNYTTLKCYESMDSCIKAFEKQMGNLEDNFMDYCNKKAETFSRIKRQYRVNLSKEY